MGMGIPYVSPVLYIVFSPGSIDMIENVTDKLAVALLTSHQSPPPNRNISNCLINSVLSLLFHTAITYKQKRYHIIRVEIF